MREGGPVLRVGVSDHLGWAVLVTADPGHAVVDRRRVQLVGEGLSAAPVHYDRGVSDDTTVLALVDEVRASVSAHAAEAFAALEGDLREPVVSLSLREWPDEVPSDLAVLRRPPWEARIDAVMYRQVLAEVAAARGWSVETFVAKGVEDRAAALLGTRADDVLHGPRARLGPPWTKDHRTALAATVLAAAG